MSMQSINDESTLKEAQSKATIIWATMLSSLGIYIGVVVFLLPELLFVELKPSSLSVLKYALIFVSAAVLLVAPSIYRQVLSSVKDKDVSLSSITGSYISALVIVMAMYEGIGLFAVVLVFFGAGMNTFLFFILVPSVAMITAQPKMDALMEHYNDSMKLTEKPLK